MALNLLRRGLADIDDRQTILMAPENLVAGRATATLDKARIRHWTSPRRPLPAIAARGLGLGGPARLATRYAQFKPAAQAGLVILDLGQQVIARGDHVRERFFWACSASSVNTQPFRPRASISSGAAGISLLFSATIKWPSTI